MSCSDTAKVTGQHLLFLGTSSATWSLAQFRQAAQFAKAHGIDSLLIKAADGAYTWYGGMNGYRQRRDVVKSEGVGVIPYTYSYGNKYGVLSTEINILKSFMQEDGIVCADMEAEWNGQTVWAKQLCSQLLGYPGVFLVSTWSDPSLQNWQGVIQALNPCVSAYMPQQYNSYLATFWGEFGANGAKCIQPTLDMTQDFGKNDPVSIAKAAHDQGHTAISIWHYETAVANPALLDQILAAFPKQESEQPMSIDLTNPKVAQYFKANGATWQCLKTGFLIGGGMLGLYQKFGGDALCGLTYLGLPQSGEISVAGHPGVTVQEFERGCLRWDNQHVIDAPPGAGDTYTVHVEQDPRAVAIQAQLTKLQTQNALLQSQVADLQNQLDTNVQAQTITALEAKIASAQKDLS